MDLKQIKELMAAMGRAGMKKLSIKEKSGFEIQLESHEEITHPPQQMAHPAFHPHYTHPHPSHHLPNFAESQHPRFPAMPASQEKAETSSKESEKAEGQFITSPMVGTFYSAASPDDPIFVKVGDTVREDTIVCIIEAMKVMNEVKAGVSGVVAEICAENAHPVEFGTKLFRIQ